MSRYTDKPASADYVLREGDTGPAIAATLKDLDGSVVDLTNASEVLLKIRQQSNDDLVVNTVATIDDAAGGAVSHEFSGGFATTGAGMHELFWRVDFDDGSSESYPRSATGYLWVPDDFSTSDATDLPRDAEVGVLSANKVGTASDPVGEGHFDSLNTEELRGGWDYLVEDTADLNNALSSLSDGETIMVVGTVRSDDWMDIDGVSDVTIRGMGPDQSAIKTDDGTEVGMFRLGQNSTVNNLTIKDITLDGAGDTITQNTVIWGNGITCLDAQDCTFKNINITNLPENKDRNDGDNSVGVGIYYPSDGITIRDFEIDSATSYRSFEITGTNVRIYDGVTRNNLERHVSLSSMRRDLRVAGNVDIENVKMINGAGSVVGSHIALHGLNYDGTGAFPDPAEGTPLGEINITDVNTEGEKRAAFAFRQLNTNAGPVTLDNVDVESPNEHGIFVGQEASSKNPDVIIDTDLEIRHATVKNSGASCIRVDGVDAPIIESPRAESTSNKCISVSNCPDFLVTDVHLDDAQIGFDEEGGESPGGILTGGKIQNTNLQNIRLSSSDLYIGNLSLESPNGSDGGYAGIRCQGNAVKLEGIRLDGAGSAGDGIFLRGDNCHVSSCYFRDFGGKLFNTSGSGNTLSANKPPQV